MNDPAGLLGALGALGVSPVAYWVTTAVVGLIILIFVMLLFVRPGDQFYLQVLGVVCAASAGLALGLIWPITVSVTAGMGLLYLVGKKVDARRAARRQP